MTQAEIFEQYMFAAWNAPTAEEPEAIDWDGFESNAVTVASTMGAKPIGQQINDAGTGDNGTEWLFPDGSTIRIITNDEGVGVGVA